MTNRDDLLREFAQITTPETPATPQFQASVNITGSGNNVAIGTKAGRGAADSAVLWLTRWLECTLPPTSILLVLAAAHAWYVGDSFAAWAANWRSTLALPIVGGVVCGWIAVFVWRGIHNLRSA